MTKRILVALAAAVAASAFGASAQAAVRPMPRGAVQQPAPKGLIKPQPRGIRLLLPSFPRGW